MALGPSDQIWVAVILKSASFVSEESLSKEVFVVFGVERHLRKECWFSVYVTVRDNNIDQALKALKKKMQREGLWREMKRRRSYEKPSERRVRKKAEAISRARKLERKRIQHEGF